MGGYRQHILMADKPSLKHAIFIAGAAVASAVAATVALVRYMRRRSPLPCPTDAAEAEVLALELERCRAGQNYDCFNKWLTLQRAWSNDLQCLFNQLGASWQAAERLEILKQLKINFPDDSPPILVPPFRCDYGYNITFGRNCFANTGFVALDCAAIEFGDNCFIGPGTQISTPNHPLEPELRSPSKQHPRGLQSALRVKIGNDVWLGGHVTIVPGVTIGDGATVAAGAVVVKDVPPRTLVAGCPAKVKKTY